MSLREIKNRIKSVGNTAKVTRALEAVSASKMRKWEERALSARPYAVEALQLLKLLKSKKSDKHILFSEIKNAQNNLIIIVVTSDKGLCGGYNIKLLEKVIKFTEEVKNNYNNVNYITIGKNGNIYLKNRQKNILREEMNWGDEVNIDKIGELYKYLEEIFFKCEASKIMVAYTDFYSAIKYEQKIRQLLPVNQNDLEEIVQGIIPFEGKYSRTRKIEIEWRAEKEFEYLFEPSVNLVLDDIVKDLVEACFYHMILESNASEHSARMVAMKNATDNSREIFNNLKLTYNKERQNKITQEILEIIGGAEALL